MPVPASTIVADARVILQDQDLVRWSQPEMASWFNAAQQELTLIRPESCVLNASLGLQAGDTKQTIPTTATRLINVVRNMGSGSTPGRAIRLANRDVLDAQNPNWHTDPAAAEIQHFVYDLRDPKVFYVYPRPRSGVYVETVLAIPPTPVTENAGVITGNLSVDDIFANAVLDYILYRAFSKDSQYAGNAARAVAHYQAFAGSVGIRKQTDALVAPGYSVSSQQSA